jgi:YD repeat-containing protein
MNTCRPAMFRRNDAWYYYLQNLQGDIVGIVNSSGAIVVEYKYDAWGRQVSITGSMASTVGRLNPFRYRGYVYDDETGLYFLYVNILPVVNYKPI